MSADLPSLTPLANHLWQSTVFVGVIWLLTFALKKNRAAVRYWLWFAASVKFLIPFSALVALGSQVSWRTTVLIVQPQWSFVVDNAVQPFAVSTAPPQVVSPHAWFTLTPILIAVWLCGVAVGLASVTKSLVSTAGYLVRTEGSPEAFIGSIRDAVSNFNSNAVVFGAETMEDTFSRSVAARQSAMTLLVIFAGLALLLSSIGIYGVISYITGQRTHEIGIRLALGACRSDVLRLVLGQGAKLALIGIAVGLAAAFALSRLMADMIFGISPHDPVTFFAVALMVMLVALVASYVPAHRVMRVDPMVALRHE